MTAQVRKFLIVVFIKSLIYTGIGVGVFFGISRSTASSYKVPLLQAQLLSPSYTEIYRFNDLERRVKEIEDMKMEHRLTTVEAFMESSNKMLMIILSAIVALVGEAFHRMFLKRA